MGHSQKDASEHTDAWTRDLSAPLDYRRANMFLHCKHCHEEFSAGQFGHGQSPREALDYEVSSYPFEAHVGVIENIVVVWCKRCARSVWDSRHLRPK